MTEIAQKLIKELERLPKEEQEERVASYLEDLQRRQQAREEPAEGEDGATEPYASFRFLREANLDLPPDFSVTYERALYGRTADLD